MPQITGLHHVTAIASDPQRNLDFYAGVLGLRLVKQTVNFDDSQSYHLYYGDGAGSPGTLLTFFAWPQGRRGRPGLGQATATALSVSPNALDFWRERLTAQGVTLGAAETRFGEAVLPFYDPDGLRLELIAADGGDGRPGWSGGSVPAEHAIQGLHSVTLPERSVEQTTRLLSELGFRNTAVDGTWTRFGSGGNPATCADIVFAPNTVSGRIAVGSIHHVAWRTPDDAEQQLWLQELVRLGYGVSPVMDRDYFRSIYFREPGGILFEIATDLPGFAIDESLDCLGQSLCLPAQLAPMRAQIEAQLPPLRLPEQNPQ